jgi:hypothetical protein
MSEYLAGSLTHIREQLLASRGSLAKRITHRDALRALSVGSKQRKCDRRPCFHL